MNNKQLDDYARQESLLELGAKLDQIEDNRRNGEKDIPADEVISRMKAAAEANRGQLRHG